MRVISLSVLMLIAAIVFGVVEVQAALTVQKVSQRHRAFDPTALQINRGDTVEVVNDDGELTHHAYVKSDVFSFDSGEQEPGAKADIVFSAAGNFTVLCRIHPRMHLDVTVR